jgi:myo-inositol-1(or 4)-monophosphatase
MEEPINIAKNAAKEAGNCILSCLSTASVSQKSSNNLVTQADIEAEQLIVETIKTTYPDASFLGEERHAHKDFKVPHLWVIDPLDGTNNFAHGIPHYGVSIAYVQNGTVVCAVVYDPLRREMFSAEVGKGAFLNDTGITVSDQKTLQESIVVTGFHYDRGKMAERTLQAIHRLFKSNIRGIRRTGSAALDMAWVASGRFDGYFEYMLSPWDFAAGMLIVREAGGICTDRVGTPLELTSEGVICTNNHIKEDFFELVRWV